jgi:DNA-directed RNA polymerase alpha subunit
MEKIILLTETELKTIINSCVTDCLVKYMPKLKTSNMPNEYISISDLSISTRLENSLRYLNCKTIGDILEYSENDIYKIRDFGKKTMQELKDVLRKYNFELKN